MLMKKSHGKLHSHNFEPFGMNIKKDLISKGFLRPPKNVLNHYPNQDSDLTHCLNDGGKVNKLPQIKSPLARYLNIFEKKLINVKPNSHKNQFGTLRIILKSIH